MGVNSDYVLKATGDPAQDALLRQKALDSNGKYGFVPLDRQSKRAPSSDNRHKFLHSSTTIRGRPLKLNPRVL